MKTIKLDTHLPRGPSLFLALCIQFWAPIFALCTEYYPSPSPPKKHVLNMGNGYFWYCYYIGNLIYGRTNGLNGWTNNLIQR